MRHGLHHASAGGGTAGAAPGTGPAANQHRVKDACVEPLGCGGRRVARRGGQRGAGVQLDRSIIRGVTR